jgi:putative polyhydroxyalkanoate system protein
MAKIEREIPNPFGVEGAKPKIAAIIEKLQASYGSVLGDVKWNDDKTAADLSGKGFKGNFAVTDKAIKIAVDLGLAASLFKGKIESEIDEKLKDFTKDDSAKA